MSWAHPKYGNILASASYDGKVFIWREQSAQWQRVFDFALHKASVNTVAWSPHESGCLLACASSDGHVSVLEFKDNNMSHVAFPAHGLGVNSVSWAPSIAPGGLGLGVSSSASASTSNQQQPGTPAPGGAGNPSGPALGQRRFVTGGCDNLLKIWAFDLATQSYKQEGEPLTGHTDWVRDVAWSPTVLQKSYIASASQDRTVRIWTSDPASASAAGQNQGQQWTSSVLNFDATVWRVSWSLSGNVLAVSGGDNKVSLWKENLRGEWECVKTMED